LTPKTILEPIVAEDLLPAAHCPSPTVHRPVDEKRK
jgi:hypothetical protein